MSLVSFEDVSCVDFFPYIIKAGVITVGDDCLTLLLEAVDVVNHLASKERRAIFQSRFVDDYRGAFGFDTFHHALDT